MKILLLFILAVLLIVTIKNTPLKLSKTIDKKKKIKMFYDNNIFEKEISEEYKQAYYTVAMILLILEVVFYIIVGTKIGTNFSTVLSVIEILLEVRCFAYSVSDISNAVIFNEDTYKFRRWHNLFNVCFNYVYLIYAIWMLMR